MITDITGRQFDDELSHFAEWWCTSTPVPLVPEGGVSFVEGVTGVVLYRKKPFQVQLFIASPNCVIPPHIHPNVDSYEVCLEGMEFTHCGKILLDFEAAAILDHNRIPKLRGTVQRVKPDEPHGARASSVGGSFLSIQQWLNDVNPSTVGNDWVGQTMGSEHSKQAGV